MGNIVLLRDNLNDILINVDMYFTEKVEIILNKVPRDERLLTIYFLVYLMKK